MKKAFLQKCTVFIAFIGILVLFSCHDKDTIGGFEKGKLRNFTGLDGCGWVIQLDDSTTLEPANLGSFNITLIDNQPIHLKYHDSPNSVSICMVGKIVIIDEIYAVK